VRYLRSAVAAVFLPCALSAPAIAADDPAPAPSAAQSRSQTASRGVNWEGFYLGGHVGTAIGTADFSSSYGPDMFGGSVATPGFLIGLQVGYNWMPRPQLLLGLEASGSYLTAQGQNTCLQPNIEQVGSNCQAFPNAIATFTGRAGYVTEPNGRTLVYGKAGAAWMHSQLFVNPNNASFDGFKLTTEAGTPASQTAGVWGWTVGAGIEYAFTQRWSVNLGYDYLRFSGINVATPQTVNVSANGEVGSVPGGTSSVSQDLHVARIGLNYRWGGPSKSPDASPGADAAATTWMPGWEIEGGARYWYSTSNFQSSNGSTPNTLVSNLSYNGMTGHSGEIFGRVDSPYSLFAKGFVGAGITTSGTMYDEDWGLSQMLASVPTGYQVTQSDIGGTFNYLTADIGYSIWRAADHKVGFFVGYNLYRTTMDAYGCWQLAGSTSGGCAVAPPSNVVGITDMSTWQSLRVGMSAQVQFWERFKVDVDLAYLPLTYVTGVDMHRARNVNFPMTGTGNGVQGELILSYALTDSFSLGVGGRYWSMWTTNAYYNDGSSLVTLSTNRYGVFLQGAYRFGTPRS
jgi:opacity protein-like surface antigen